MELLQDLPRKDQRHVGTRYIEGLLSTAGRKTARGMAEATCSTAEEQRFNHFISGSTWDWRNVTERLRVVAAEALHPTTWVLDQIQIPKTGSRSIGVESRYDRRSGRTVHAQRGFGIWGVRGPRASSLGWHLDVPAKWVSWLPPEEADSLARWGRRATPERTALVALHESLPGPEAVHTPVVADCRGLDAPALLVPLMAQGQPFVIRVSGRMRLRLTDRDLYTWTGQVLVASRIVAASRGLRRGCRDERLTMAGIRLVRSVGVRLPGEVENLRLVMSEPNTGSRRGSLWLTNMSESTSEQVLGVGTALNVVETVREQQTAQVGLRDFTGRSYAGWHRHMAMVAAAHHVRTFGAGRSLGWPRPDEPLAGDSILTVERDPVGSHMPLAATSA